MKLLSAHIQGFGCLTNFDISSLVTSAVISVECVLTVLIQNVFSAFWE